MDYLKTNYNLDRLAGNIGKISSFNKREKLEGELFKGDFNKMSVREFTRNKKFAKGVKSPVDVRTVKIAGKVYSQFFHNQGI